jgi:hypothetical protein
MHFNDIDIAALIGDAHNEMMQDATKYPILVCHVRHAPAGAVYLGRAMPKHANTTLAPDLLRAIRHGSPACNPFKATDGRGSALARYAEHLARNLQRPDIYALFRDIVTRVINGERVVLACWCAEIMRPPYKDPTQHTDGCHCDIFANVVIECVNQLDAEDARNGTQEGAGATENTMPIQDASMFPRGYDSVASEQQAPTIKGAPAALISAGIPKDKCSLILAALHSNNATMIAWAVAMCKAKIDVAHWRAAWGLSDFLTPTGHATGLTGGEK